MARIFLLFTVLFSVVSYGDSGDGFSGDYDVKPVPDWVEKIVYEEPDNKTVPGQKVRYLLVDEQRKVFESDSHYYSHYTTMPVNQVGVSESSEIFIGYYPEYQNLVLHNVQVIRDGQVESRLETSEIREASRESDLYSSIYTGERQLSIIVNDVRPGDIVDYSYTIEGTNPVFEGAVFGIVRAGWNVPVNYQYYRMVAPKKLKINHKNHGLTLEPSVSRKGKLKEYVWQQRDVSFYENEDGQAPWHTSVPFIQYSEFDRWKDVNKWAKNLFSDRADITLPEQVASHLSQLSSDEEKLLYLLNFVQDDIRYISLSIGENSHRPSKPSDVIKNRYGDCKDKSQLLVRLLEKVGIQAEVALVSTSFNSGVTKLLPSPGVFNHAIVKVNLDGQDVWLDPTDSYQRGDLNKLGFHYYGAALVVDGKRNELMDVKPLNGQLDYIELEESYTAENYTQPVQLKLSSKYCGAYADYYRYQAATKTTRDMQNDFLNFMSNYYPDVEFTAPLEIVDDEKSNCITYMETYSIDDFWESKDNRLTGYFYTLALKDYLKKPKVRFRKSPYYIGRGKTLVHRAHFDFPTDVGLDLNPEPALYETKGVKYKTFWQYEDKKLLVESVLNTEPVEVDAKELKGYLKEISRIEDDLSYSIYFPDPSYIQGKHNALLDMLKNLGNNSEGT